MRLHSLVLAAALVLFAAPALAYHCPIDMAKIDEALAQNPNLGEEELADVKKYRTLGEKQHNAGDHGASVATLKKAMDILGIE